jgi:hypothetical protein
MLGSAEALHRHRFDGDQHDPDRHHYTDDDGDD